MFFHPGLGRLKHEQTMICLAHGAKINSYCSDKNNKGICCIFAVPSLAVSVEQSEQGACRARREKRGRERGGVGGVVSAFKGIYKIFYSWAYFFFSGKGLQWGS